jgi:hypothetical protein
MLLLAIALQKATHFLIALAMRRRIHVIASYEEEDTC